jgi:GSH-dependent disulfide-bond oxidoreductase
VIDLYTWTTPNGHKAQIALEELELPYTTHWIDISKGAQNTPAFIAINPNSKIPALVDSDGPGGEPITVFESGAILIYLADKTGKLLGQGVPRYAALEWLMFQMGGVGPMFGQLGHFKVFAKEKIAYAIERYDAEVKRLCKVLDGRLAAAPYLANDYSIADIATFPWVRIAPQYYGLAMAEYPNVARWLAAIEARPAVARALAMKP